MKNSRIILKKNNSDVFFKYIHDRPIENYYRIKDTSILFKIARKLKLLFLFRIFLGNWTKNIKQYQKIIMFDNGFNEMIAQYVKKKKPNTKVILWYWNPVTEYSKQFLQSKYIDEFWSYNKADVKQYKLHHNSQFYTSKITLNKENKQLESDIIFLGNAKTRKENILEFEKELNQRSITTNFKIVEKKEEYINYDQYLEMISKSKCILDYNEEEQIALTLRPMEALFLKKKLITNNKDIINYNFYHPDNIFVIGIDEMDKIQEFIKSPYIEVDQKTIKCYDFEQWIERFEI